MIKVLYSESNGFYHAGLEMVPFFVLTLQTIGT